MLAQRLNWYLIDLAPLVPCGQVAYWTLFSILMRNHDHRGSLAPWLLGHGRPWYHIVLAIACAMGTMPPMLHCSYLPWRHRWLERQLLMSTKLLMATIGHGLQQPWCPWLIHDHDPLEPRDRFIRHNWHTSIPGCQYDVIACEIDAFKMLVGDRPWSQVGAGPTVIWLICTIGVVESARASRMLPVSNLVMCFCIRTKRRGQGGAVVCVVVSQPALVWKSSSNLSRMFSACRILYPKRSGFPESTE